MAMTESQKILAGMHKGASPGKMRDSFEELERENREEFIRQGHRQNMQNMAMQAMMMHLNPQPPSPPK